MLVGRKSGPLFLTDRKARPAVAKNDVDPATGRARLSCRRAAELFEAHTERFDDGPYTLHRLRHSRLTHAAEEGASTPVLMKLSGHTSVRSPRGTRRYPTKGYGVIKQTATPPRGAGQAVDVVRRPVVSGSRQNGR
ncbi:integrase [Nocardia sp. GAS34]|uniref:site-specific integrase n=1 Tax=unclassified Nocardia TaxID=2637762 RepID=UPI003D1CFA15